LLHERLAINGLKQLNAAAGLRGKPVIASFYATTWATTQAEQLAYRVRDLIPEQYRRQLGITLVDGLLIARYLGDSTETARRLFIEIWKALRPTILHRSPCVPRIWNT
jgi:urease accessory protein